LTLQHTAPFLRLLLPFSLGISVGLQLRTSTTFPVAVGAMVLFICAASFCALTLTFSSRGRNIPASISYLTLLLAGMLAAMSRDTLRYSDHYTHFELSTNLLLRISDAPQERPGFWKCQAEVKALTAPQARRTCSGNILLYIKADSSNKKTARRYGDLLRVKGARLQAIPGAAYPEAFDYAAMMRERNIVHRLFAADAQIQFLGNNANPIMALAYDAASWTDTRLQEHFTPRTAAVLASLLIGLRTDIEAQDIAAFKNTGTLHVLAVSGMHIALIYNVLMWLTSMLPTWVNRIFRLLIVAAVVWTYACISGFSASVCRAALMCSIMLLGKALRKESTLANNLCAAAFLLLLWEPRWLNDAGFLLSFTAVAGILMFQPLFAQYWKPEPWLLRQVWSLLTVSSAAQLGTLPVSLYFFHQFATYFLVGNLLIIPLSTIALFGGLAFLALGKMIWIGPALHAISSFTTNAMLHAAGWIGSLPHALLEGGNQGFSEALVLTLALVAGAWWLQQPGKHKPWLMLTSLLLFTALHAARDYWECYKQEAAIYARKNAVWSLLVRKGNASVFISNDTTFNALPAMQPYLKRYGLKPKLVLWSGKTPWVAVQESQSLDQPDVFGKGAITRLHITGADSPKSALAIYVWNKKGRPPELPGALSGCGSVYLTAKASGTLVQLPPPQNSP